MMLTEVLKPVYSDFPNDIALIKAAEILKNGGIAAIPTETVYGLAANGLSSAAVKKIYAAKGRPSDNPLIYHISDLDMLYDIVKTVPETARKLAERFWAGALTMIFPKKSHIPAEAVCGLDTVAVRMPDNTFTLSLINLCGFPLAAPSANLSGSPSPTSAEHVFKDMNGKIPLIIDGSICSCGVESTVITFEKSAYGKEIIRVLRPGAVTAEELSEFAETVTDRFVTEKLQENNKPISPGIKYKHYSPKACVILVETLNNDEFNSYVLLQKELHGEKNLFALVFDNENPPPCRYLTYGKTDAEQAGQLFSKLRELDETNADTVFVRAPEKDGLGLAVYNRLIRAADFNVIRINNPQTLY